MSKKEPIKKPKKAKTEAPALDPAAAKAAKPKGQIETKAKLKFDRQIIAIAKVNGVKQIYSDDVGLEVVASSNGITVTHTWQLPLPPTPPQQELD